MKQRQRPFLNSSDISWQQLLLVLGSSAILLLVHLLIPMSPDNDTYQAMGWELLKHGRLPYIGSWDQNFPGIVYLHAFGIALFGNSDLGFRILDCLAFLSCIAALTIIVSRWMSFCACFISATLFTLYYLSTGFWGAGQRDQFAIMFILWSVYFLYKAK